ncbi:MAG: type II secretion system secretin GspD [Burkholderiales bacterium]
MRADWFRTALLCMALLAGAGRAWPADAERVTLNFVNADIESVVKAVGEITGKNFVIDPRVKGTVNIISSKPVSRSLVYDIFLSALRIQGYAAIEDRNLVRIVPEAEAKEYRTPVRGPGQAPRSASDLIETEVFALQHESAAQLVPILRPLITRNNTIAAYPAGNTLVITDYASNLMRIGKIIESIDQPDSTEPVLIALNHASALDVAQSVSRVFSDAAQAAGGATAGTAHQLTIVPDARSNSLIVRAANPSWLFRVRSLVAMLDTPTNASGSIHVVYMKNAEATRVAETLRAIYLGQAGASTPRASATLMPTAASATSTGATPQFSQSSGASAAASPAAGFIQADPATNSVIINAPDAVYNNLRAVLDKLDVRRAQVYVEALIAEVTADKAAEFGIQWQALGGLDSSSVQAFGGTNFGGTGQNIIGLTQNVASASRGLNIGVVDGKVTIPGVGQVVNLGILARALESDANANILSTPTLLTLDNEEAVISVGQNVPFITGQYAVSGAATTPTPFQTVERRDVGLTLRVRPQISENGTVQLQIYQEVSSVQDTANAAGIITNKRAVASTVLVDDGQIVVIGGLIQDSVNDGIEKVPGLGDLPLLGGLFRYKTRSQTKTNLMIFLRPTVVRDSARADAFSSDRYNYIIGEQKRLQPAHDAVLPDVTAPTLPPLAPAKKGGK